MVAAGKSSREGKKGVRWDNLPGELLEEVGKRLESRIEVDRFRSVCKTWRSSLNPPTRFPMWIPPPPGVHDFDADNMPYFLTQHTVYSVDGDSNNNKCYNICDDLQVLYQEDDELIPPHLVVFEEVNQGGVFCPNPMTFSYPCCRAKVGSFIDTPTKTTAEQQFGPLVLGEDEDKVKRSLLCVSTSFHIQEACPVLDSNQVRVEGKWEFVEIPPFVTKTVLVSCSGSATPNCYSPESDLAVVVLLGDGQLAMLTLTPRPLAWRTIPFPHVIHDIVLYNGKFCFIDTHGRVFTMDVKSLQMTLIAHLPTTSASTPCGFCDMINVNNAPDSVLWSDEFIARNRKPRDRRHRLVDAFGDLFILVPGKRPTKEQPKIKVYKLMNKISSFVEVERLGDQAFFVGLDFSFSLRTAAPEHVSLTNRIFHDISTFFWHGSAGFVMEGVHDKHQHKVDASTRSGYSTFLFWLDSFILPSSSAVKSSISTLTSTSTVVSHYESTCWIHSPQRLTYLRSKAKKNL